MSYCNALISRYFDLAEQKINLFNFLFSKHGDHNYFFVYLLSLVAINLKEVTIYSESELHLNIFLHGMPLNGMLVGYLSEFEVIY